MPFTFRVTPPGIAMLLPPITTPPASLSAKISDVAFTPITVKLSLLWYELMTAPFPTHTLLTTPRPPDTTNAPVVGEVEIPVPVNVTSPDAVRVVNAPVDGVALPIGVPFSDVALVGPRLVVPVDVRVWPLSDVNAPELGVAPPIGVLLMLDALVAPSEVVPVDVRAVNAPVDGVALPIGVPFNAVALVIPSVVVLDEDRVVNAPVDGVALPIGVPLIAVASAIPKCEVEAVRVEAVTATGVVPPMTTLSIEPVVPELIVTAPVVFAVRL